jgi:uncharacterized protein YqhQ
MREVITMILIPILRVLAAVIEAWIISMKKKKMMSSPIDLDEEGSAQTKAQIIHLRNSPKHWELGMGHGHGAL